MGLPYAPALGFRNGRGVALCPAHFVLLARNVGAARTGRHNGQGGAQNWHCTFRYLGHGTIACPSHTTGSLHSSPRMGDKRGDANACYILARCDIGTRVERAANLWSHELSGSLHPTPAQVQFYTLHCWDRDTARFSNTPRLISRDSFASNRTRRRRLLAWHTRFRRLLHMGALFYICR